MDDSWQQTDHIVMAVQTAEIRQLSVTTQPTLHLSCSLVNIARGQCVLEVTAAPPAAAKGNSHTAIGSLIIEINRPVMRGTALVPATLYELLVARLGSGTPRPVQIIMAIASQLAVSLEGDLRIDEETSVEIIDLSVTMPVK